MPAQIKSEKTPTASERPRDDYQRFEWEGGGGDPRPRDEHGRFEAEAGQRAEPDQSRENGWGTLYEVNEPEPAKSETQVPNQASRKTASSKKHPKVKRA